MPMAMYLREFLRKKSWRKKLVEESVWLSSIPVKSYHANSTSRMRTRRSMAILGVVLDAAVGFADCHDNLILLLAANDFDSYSKMKPESSSTNKSAKILLIKSKESAKLILVQTMRVRITLVNMDLDHRDRGPPRTRRCNKLVNLMPQARVPRTRTEPWREK